MKTFFLWTKVFSSFCCCFRYILTLVQSQNPDKKSCRRDGTDFIYQMFVFSDIPFPKSFLPTAKKILTRLFRVFVHIYMHHFERLQYLKVVSVALSPTCSRMANDLAKWCGLLIGALGQEMFTISKFTFMLSYKLHHLLRV